MFIVLCCVLTIEDDKRLYDSFLSNDEDPDEWYCAHLKDLDVRPRNQAAVARVTGGSSR